MTRRAIGIVRVSVKGDREGERFASPDEQRDRLTGACQRDGLTLLEVHEEMDVSGGKPLDGRPGLSAAVKAVEDGRAEVVVAAYFDRLFRSLQTQAEVIDRIERAGGKVLAVDVGHVTNESAGQWLSGTMMGAVSEYFRRSAKERSAEGQARAIARGAAPWSHVAIGYRRREDGVFEPNPKAVPVAQRAFGLRAEGATIQQVADYLTEHGYPRSHCGVRGMLKSRVYLGEIHWGKHVNLEAHPAIIDRELWERVQRMVVPRGRKSPSRRLLSRLRVLRCGNCGGLMGAMKVQQNGDYPVYRCPYGNPCPSHLVISATIVEEVVMDAVRRAIANEEGRASMAALTRDAYATLSATQDALDGALRAFVASGTQDEPAAVERLNELRQARDDAQRAVDNLPPEALKVIRAEHVDEATDDEKRELIRALVRRVDVAPGRRVGGPREVRVAAVRERVHVHLFGL